MKTRDGINIAIGVLFVISAISLLVCLVCKIFNVEVLWLEMVYAISLGGMFAVYLIIYPIIEMTISAYKRIRRIIDRKAH